MVKCNARRVATVYAIEISLVYRLERKDFQRVAQAYPDFIHQMEKLASVRGGSGEQIINF